MQVLPSTAASDAAAGLSTVVEGLLAGRRGAEADPGTVTSLWKRLVDDGWTGLAADGTLSLRDLMFVVETWGRSCVPLPFVTTLLRARWSGAPLPGAGTFAVPASTGVVVPWGSFPGIDGGSEGSTVDDFAVTLPLSATDASVGLDRQQRWEFEVLAVAECLGLAGRELGTAVGYACTREQFGKPIGQFQAVAHLLADAHRDIEIARSLLLADVNGLPASGHTAAVAEAVTRCRHVLDRCIQVHGGMGFTWEAGLQFALRHIITTSTLLTL